MEDYENEIPLLEDCERGILHLKDPAFERFGEGDHALGRSEWKTLWEDCDRRLLYGKIRVEDSMRMEDCFNGKFEWKTP